MVFYVSETKCRNILSKISVRKESSIFNVFFAIRRKQPSWQTKESEQNTFKLCGINEFRIKDVFNVVNYGLVLTPLGMTEEYYSTGNGNFTSLLLQIVTQFRSLIGTKRLWKANSCHADHVNSAACYWHGLHNFIRSTHVKYLYF
jgi:hypothetical protein